MDIYKLVDGELEIYLHPGQQEAMLAEERIIAIIAGAQSGKTSFGPIWLLQEIAKCGPGDYAVVAPTFKIMEPKVIPELRRLFEETLELGRYTKAPIQKFDFSPEAVQQLTGKTGHITIYFGHAANPDSLESATYKAVWIDEGGQDGFKFDSWDALKRRVAIHRGRILITTTPYSFNWLKTKIHDQSHITGGPDQTIRVIRFESRMNPSFPLAEWDSLEATTPKWKFDMFYRGIFTQPAGTIYDCIDEKKHFISSRFRIPEEWPRFMGLDFGPVNTAAVFVAMDPKTKKMVVYRTYHTGGKTTAQHISAMLGKGQYPSMAVGGAPSEEGTRKKYASAGLVVAKPQVSSVWDGIQCVYDAIMEGRLFFFDNLSELKKSLQTYSRKMDDDGVPTEEIKDKNTFHLLDGLRYVISEVDQNQVGKSSRSRRKNS